MILNTKNLLNIIQIKQNESKLMALQNLNLFRKSYRTMYTWPVWIVNQLDWWIFKIFHQAKVQWGNCFQKAFTMKDEYSSKKASPLQVGNRFSMCRINFYLWSWKYQRVSSLGTKWYSVSFSSWYSRLICVRICGAIKWYRCSPGLYPRD